MPEPSTSTIFPSCNKNTPSFNSEEVNTSDQPPSPLCDAGKANDDEDFLLGFLPILFIVFLFAVFLLVVFLMAFFVVLLAIFLAVFLAVFLLFGRDDLATFFLVADFTVDKDFFAKLVPRYSPVSLGAPNLIYPQNSVLTQ
ncbi:MAG: hypothetical protein KAI27_05805 [Rhodospirillaceae bacterium]|nr:hypothetical protein [Rhodospirillaceae bacterium]